MGERDRTLRRFYDETFEPDVLGESSDNTRKQYRQAVQKFIAWCGCDVSVDGCREVLIERWARCLVRDGMTIDNSRKLRAYLRRIVRHRYPDRCLKQPGRRPHETRTTSVCGMNDSELRKPSSVLEFFEQEYLPRRMVGCKLVSIDCKRLAVRKFARFLGRCPMLSDLTEDVVTAFQSWQLHKGDSPHTVNSATASIVAIWNFAARRKLVSTRPDEIERVKAPQRLPRAWSMAELQTILKAAAKATYPKKGIRCRACHFWPAVILAGYDTGLRVRALFSVRLADFDADQHELRVVAEFMKTGVEQTFRLSPQTVEAIEVILPRDGIDQRERLFEFPFRREHAHRCMRKILKSCGLYQKGSGNLFHQLRRTSATHLTAAVGWEAASRHLGHSSVQMTRNYVDVRFLREHKAADHLPRPVLQEVAR